MMLKGLVLRVVLLLIVLVGFNTPAFGVVEVNFPDPGLEAAIRDAIGKPTGPIYDTDLTGWTYLNASERGIIALTGLEYCTDLTDLNLYNNAITNISPLAGLTSLEWIRLSRNLVNDLGPLAGLTNLTQLELDDNQISGIGPLAGLTNLTTLILDDNQINNLSPLIWLTNLIELSLDNNDITNTSPLVANGGIDTGDKVWLFLNPLSCTSITDHIPTLQARGVTVLWTQNDTDVDSILDACDNCPLISNPGQEDTGDGFGGAPDGVGDECQCGDVTRDGTVNSADATMIVRRALGLTAPEFNVPCNCDVTDDGECNSADAATIVRHALGLTDPNFYNSCGNYTGSCVCDSSGNCLP